MHSSFFIPGWCFHRKIFQDLLGCSSVLKNRPKILVAWSFGGLEALKRVSNAQEEYQGLILIASTPKFMGDHNWPGITQNAKTYFLKRLKGTEERFKSYYFSLVGTSPRLEKNFLSPANHRCVLSDLFESDLRGMFSKINIPILSVLGQKDPIVPSVLNDHLGNLNANVSSVTLAHEGHAPFLTNTALVAQIIDQFICEKC